jgi:hypothetical protein
MTNWSWLNLQDTIFKSKRLQLSFGSNFHWVEGFSKFILFIHMHMQDHDKSQSYMFLTKRNFAKYRWRTYNRWQIALIPVVSSSGMTYTHVVSVPTEKLNRHIFTYITTYPPSSARAFNVARTTLHMLRERIHVLRKRPQDIPRSHTIGARSWSVARLTRSPYHTIGTVLKQVSSWGDGSGIHITR